MKVLDFHVCPCPALAHNLCLRIVSLLVISVSHLMAPTLMVHIGIQQLTFSDSAAYSLFLQQVGTLKT